MTPATFIRIQDQALETTNAQLASALAERPKDRPNLLQKIQRYRRGYTPIPPETATLMRYMERYGLPDVAV